MTSHLWRLDADFVPSGVYIIVVVLLIILTVACNVKVNLRAGAPTQRGGDQSVGDLQVFCVKVIYFVSTFL